MGALCEIRGFGGLGVPAQVIGFEGARTLLTGFGKLDGIRPGDPISLVAPYMTLRVSPELLGRVVDSQGKVIDHGKPIFPVSRVRLDNEAPIALDRPPIDQILHTGVRAIDTLFTVGRGQRVGIFAGSGVGKSRLLGMLARGSDADVIVVGLIGERGREVQEFLQRELTPAARQRCVTVVATSDQAALRRVQAAHAATAIAEYFRDQGQHVLLLMDSITRCATAQREIGLASGEAPTTRGFPASVFSMLPKLVERSGTHRCGTITGVYTVLVEGDDPNEPISDALRGLLDGHIQLSRKIAHRGRFPAIDVLSSLSRLQSHLVDSRHLRMAARLRQLVADFHEHEDLINVGAYEDGRNPRIDQAISLRQEIESFLHQDSSETCGWDSSIQQLAALVS